MNRSVVMVAFCSWLGASAGFAEPAKSLPASVLRERPVDASFIQLPEPSPQLAVGERESLHAPLLLELFDGAEYEAVVESVERTPRAVIWRGRIGGSTPFWVSRAGGSVLFTGQTPDGRTFEAAPGDDGQLRLMEIDDSKFEPEGEPVVQRAESRGQRAEGQRAGDEGEAVIDVLFLYTKTLLMERGGGNPALIVNMAELSVATTNDAFANSGIHHRLRIAGIELLDYTEPGLLPWRLVLDSLSAPLDGEFDSVYARMHETKADLVCLLVNDKLQQFCGLAQLLTRNSPDEGPKFAMVSYRCATANQSFAHEIGHTMGAQHDWPNAQDKGIYDYGYGFVDPQSRFRTVMAYADCACPRIHHFSNPDVFYEGSPTGTSSANNALVLNQTAAAVSQFSEAEPRPVPPRRRSARH